MGYTTEFTGAFSLSRTLTVAEFSYLKAFGNTRRMKRAIEIVTFPDPLRAAVGLPIGDEGAYYVGGSESAAVADDNTAPAGQPGFYCDWVPTDDGAGIEWDGSEKFRNYREWMDYLIQHFLQPWGITVSGQVFFQGEEISDDGRLFIRNGKCVQAPVGAAPFVDDTGAPVHVDGDGDVLKLDGRFAFWDRTEKVALTSDYVAALEHLLRTELAMMRAHDGNDPVNWTWGRAEIGDLASSNGLSLTYGGDDDRHDVPEGQDVLVVVREAQESRVTPCA